MISQFEIVGGTVTGRDHLLAGRNNQDAFYWFAQKDRRQHTSNRLVAVVADGCGSSPHSEVGAKIGVRLTVKALLEELDFLDELRDYGEDPSEHPFWESARKRLLQSLIGTIGQTMAGSKSEMLKDGYPRVVNECLLFTIVGVLITPHETSIFSIGDGFFAVNGAVTEVGPFPGNAPPYLAYEYLGSSLLEANPSLLKFQVHRGLPTSEVSSLLIGTDGVSALIKAVDRNLPGRNDPVGPLSQFWTDDRYFRNPDMVRRRLTLVNRDATRIDWEQRVVERESGLLPDDTTVVVVRRKKT